MDIFAAFGAVVLEAARLERPRPLAQERPQPQLSPMPRLDLELAAGMAPPPRRHWPRPAPGMVPLEFMSPVVRP